MPPCLKLSCGPPYPGSSGGENERIHILKPVARGPAVRRAITPKYKQGHRLFLSFLWPGELNHSLAKNMNSSRPTNLGKPIRMFPNHKRFQVLWVAAILLLLTPYGFSQDEGMALIKGQFSGSQIPDEISLNTVRNGAPVKHSSVKVAKDGRFGFYFQPEYTGFYTLGDRASAAVRLYISPGKTVQLKMEDELFSVGVEDRENTLLANWAKILWDLKKCNQLRGNYTYKEIFPMLPGLEKAKDEFLARVKGGEGRFDQLFPKLVEAEFEYELYHFLYMPRTIHPAPEDRPEIYTRISSAPRFTDDTAMNFDFGMAFASTYCMYQHSAHQNEFADKGTAAAEVALKYLPDETVRGWYLATNVLTRSRAYDDAYIAKLGKYREYLVTDDQRKLVSDFVLTINKTGKGEPAMPFEGSTPDGKKVSLKDFKGKVVLVDVWATWCGPCRAEIPSLKKLEEEMKGKDVVFISYSVDKMTDLAKWKKMVSDEELGGVQLIGDSAFQSSICTDYKITGIPRFMVFDKNGNIVSVDAPRPSNPDLKLLLEKCL
jgi:thiol-disulfide isomerase/thioredoxin